MRRGYYRSGIYGPGIFNRRGSPSLITGLVIVVIGVVMLLDRLDIFPAENLFQFWPTILVALGLLKLTRPPGCPGRTFGGMLVVAGVLFQLTELHILHLSWDQTWPVLVIALGVLLVWRAIESRVELNPETPEAPPGVDHTRLNEFAVFGGGERHINSQEFGGGDVVVVFGGLELDLRHAGTKDKEVRIEVNAIFGGVEIKVPESWNVTVRGTGIFGGYGDETRHPRAHEMTNSLILTGVAIFGGVSVKN